MINSFLNSLTNNEALPHTGEYSLDNMIMLLDSLDNPHQKIKFIHVAGTNGKGSVCLMLASIFETSGYKTGLYTSPHLLKINERIKINSKEISDELFIKYLNIIQYKITEKSIRPTFFDVLTVVSILYFADENIDIAVMETGLGGRLDSTNVITPLCCVITDISFDHESILGHTIEKITFEKCGIIKKNISVITTNTKPEIISIIQKRCIEMNSDLFVYGADFIGENPEFSSSSLLFNYIELKNNNRIHSISVNHPGQFQIKNSCSAVFIALRMKKIFHLIANSIIIDSLKNLKFPGRFEQISSRPMIFFDPAHNIEAVTNIINILINYWNTFNIHIIFSLMSDKNISKITELFSQNFKKLVYFKLDDQRAFSPDEKWRLNSNIEIIYEKTKLAEYIACNNSADSLFFFIGSFRLYKTAQEIAEKLDKP